MSSRPTGRHVARGLRGDGGSCETGLDMLLRRSLALVALAVSASACSPSAKGKPATTPARAADPWEETPHEEEWLHATRGVPSGHESECKAVVTWIEGEKDCQAKLCAHGRDLAKDWLSRCKPFVAASVEEVTDLHDSLKRRAKEAATSCSRAADAILRGECGGAGPCKAKAEDWGTTCGKSDGTPLVVRMLERAVERRSDGAKFRLDVRSCADMLAEVSKASSCAQTFVCADALAGVDAYRKRCDEGEAPSLGAAVLMAAIAHGAGKQAPVLARPGSADLPTALADGTGAALWVCGERVSDLATYLARRKACKGGEVVYAKGFKKGDQLEVRVAKLPFSSDADFGARFPSLAVRGEAGLRDAQGLAAFEARLGEIAKQGALGAGPLVQLIIENAGALRRSGAYREALSSKDTALSVTLAEIGKRKAAAAKGRLTVAELAGLHGRAATRAFADLAPDGTVRVGAATRAAELETAELLPKATTAYLDAYAPAEAIAARRKVDGRTAELAKAYGRIQAVGCGSAQKALSAAEQAYLACAFGTTSCDASQLVGVLADIDKARADAEAARHNLDVVMTGAAATYKGQLIEIATTEGCFEPWWL